jgi:hypothetical protein
MAPELLRIDHPRQGRGRKEAMPDSRITINLRVEIEAALRAHAKEFATKVGMTSVRDCEKTPNQRPRVMAAR